MLYIHIYNYNSHSDHALGMIATTRKCSNSGQSPDLAMYNQLHCSKRKNNDNEPIARAADPSTSQLSEDVGENHKTGLEKDGPSCKDSHRQSQQSTLLQHNPDG
jgi:hypothetical protein